MAAWTQTVTASVLGIGVLALIYAMLSGLIAAEQCALLIGALVLLVMVALMMYLTRRIDWHAYAPTSTEPLQSPPAIMERS